MLKAHRLARGWSARQAIEELEDLCEQHGLGLPRANIDLLNAWENNRARPRPQTIDLLARLYKANAVRLGLAADYCEDTGGPKVVVVAQGRPEEAVRADAGHRTDRSADYWGDHSADHSADHSVDYRADHSADYRADYRADHRADHRADDARRRALFHHATLMGRPDGRFFAEVEGTRHDLDRALAIGTVTEDQLDRLDEQVLRHRREYMTTPPMPMLCRVMLEIADVRKLTVMRQPASAQRRLLTATTMLALLSADALMKLGDTRQAHAWYGTARTASDDVGDLRLRALVRAQQTMLLYYYGDLNETVRLAREARMLAGSAPSSPAALAAAAEARALARMGDGKAARTALAEAEQIFARMRGLRQDDLAFVFTEKRMVFYRTGTLIELGDAQPIEAIDAFPPGFQTIDPALILLDQAAHLARNGDHEEACRIAAEALSQVPAEHRTSIVVTRAKALLADADPRRPAVRHLSRVLAESSARLAL
ncbi:helix-turn-helix domain-containing protein [Microtetraspora malaysiensis]|uniref:Helix-turn-helix domain-containing protein n=1 Tax=Microtetraspora malaysiensis TaxID=161358 RepID=A0ABW6SW61_9ACTN